mmetsp:Transcript_22296/g.45912  ORF Transcript_22296/g.45912 Transcript_22296/m.45912 type:complete len:205 (+) Transcript_22296:71-685(+)|eukprot:s1215_g9.t1
MAKAARAVAILILGLCLCSLPAFVPGPGRFARTVAPAAVGAGALGMLGAAPAYADRIDDAAKVLSEKSYPFLKEIDWTSDVYAKLPTQNALDVLKAISTMLKMGASMDPAALKAGVLAHSQAIANVDSKGVATLADYTAINAAIGHMISSVPASQTMDVYNAFNKFSLGKDVGPYMMSKVNAADAKAAYQALMDFKDVVKASQR